MRASHPLVAGVAVFAVAFGLWMGLFALRGARAGDGFDLLRWELAAFANKWLYALGAPARGGPAPDEALARYFALADRRGDEARALENAVEAAIEGRLDAAVREAGIGAPLALPGPLAVWPPVDIEIAGSPRLLVVSPRAEIRRAGGRLLLPGLDAAALAAIERETEARDASISALAVPTGGIATYPAIVRDSAGYRGLVGTAAHEWVHHYLSFHPLGWALLRGGPDALTINETVANVAGDELRDIAIARFGDPSPPPSAAPAAAPAVDRAAVLRALRLEVDALLAEGRIGEAERRMEEVRLELAEGGVRIRRLNQAWFAFYGSYADRPDATDPLGPAILEIRERSGSLARFLELVRGATDRAAVERLLAALRDGAR